MDNQNLRKILYAFACVLGIILIGLLAWFALDIKSLYQNGAFHLAFSRTARRNRTIISPTQIQDWMTFRYINHIFQLPNNYLATQLKITDPYYPNLVIGAYAAGHKLNSAQFLLSVKQAVGGYPTGGSQ